MQAVRNVLRTSVCRLQMRNAATTPAKPNPRRMKFPYTLAAQWDQFPFRMHYEGFWLYRWYIPGFIATFLVFMKINNLVNSPGNVAAYEARKKREAEAKHHH